MEAKTQLRLRSLWQRLHPKCGWSFVVLTQESSSQPRRFAEVKRRQVSWIGLASLRTERL